MAALTIGNPIVITGSMGTSYKTQLAAASPGGGVNNTSYGTLTTLKVEKIIWVSAPNGATLSIGDPNSGLVLWTRKNNTGATADIEDDFTANPRIWTDFEIDIFVGGTLYIYTR